MYGISLWSSNMTSSSPMIELSMEKINKKYFYLHFTNFDLSPTFFAFSSHQGKLIIYLTSQPNSDGELICFHKAAKKVQIQVSQKSFFCGSQLDGSFLLVFYLHLPKQKWMPKMGGRVTEPRLPQTQKCMTHREVTIDIKKHIGSTHGHHFKGIN